MFEYKPKYKEGKKCGNARCKGVMIIKKALFTEDKYLQCNKCIFSYPIEK